MSAPTAAQDRTRLTVSGLTVTYHNGHTALRDAGFTLEGDSLCALLGVNGSGKYALFKNIMGMVRPSAGLICLNELPVAGRPTAEVRWPMYCKAKMSTGIFRCWWTMWL